MPYNPRYHHRQSIRLPNWDYSSPGAYFVTLVTWQNTTWFGEIMDRQVQLSPLGKIAHNELALLPGRFPCFEVDTVVIMPDHLHAIFVKKTTREDGSNSSQNLVAASHSTSLGNVIGQYKARMTRRFHALIGKHSSEKPMLWQRNYYEHIIRNQREWDEIRRYIQLNPERWQPK